jgi:hypothetical protein
MEPLQDNIYVPVSQVIYEGIQHKGDNKIPKEATTWFLGE